MARRPKQNVRVSRKPAVIDEERDERWLAGMRRRFPYAADSRDFFEGGERWTDDVARKGLPILLGLARKRRCISYKELAEALNNVYGLPIPKSFRNYGRPLGKIFQTLRFLWKEWNESVPPINLLVVNGQLGQPGHGAESIKEAYWARVAEPHGRGLGNEGILDDIRTYDWGKVADHFGIRVIEPPNRPVVIPTQSYTPGPESPEHCDLKTWVRDHPEFLEEHFGVFQQGTNEKRLLSGDRLDVHFSNRKAELAIEVKVSSKQQAGYFESECFRGVFQCVKYKAILEAQQTAGGVTVNARAALVYQGSFPLEARRLELIS